MNPLQQLVKDAYDAWEVKGKITRPTLADSLDFLATEVAEAIDARLRMRQPGLLGWIRRNLLGRRAYTRNHSRVCTEADVAKEVVDALIMCLVTLNRLDADAEKLLAEKLREMDAKRDNVAWKAGVLK